jgi:uncharacterized membrane protein
MYSMLLPIHLACAGIWLGCVLTETLFERALLGKGREQELILAELHKRVDLLIEIPAFTIVLITGILLLPDAGKNGLLLLKIIFGAIAIITNIYCVILVFKRARAANQGRWGEFTHLDKRQHIYGAAVLLTLIASLALGSYTYAYT